MKQSRAKAPASSLVSAGPLFFMDDKLEPERAAQDRIKAETIARVAARPRASPRSRRATNDWADGARRAREARGDRAAAAIGPLPSGRPRRRRVVREVGGVKVGFVGCGPARRRSARRPTCEARRAPGRRARPSAQGAKVLVALAAVGRGEAKRIADAVPELDGRGRRLGQVERRREHDGAARRAGRRRPHRAGGQPPADRRGPRPLRARARQPGTSIKFADATGIELARKREELARRIDELHVKIASWERDPQRRAARTSASRRHDLARLEAERDALDEQPPPAEAAASSATRCRRSASRSARTRRSRRTCSPTTRP